MIIALGVGDGVEPVCALRKRGPVSLFERDARSVRCRSRDALLIDSVENVGVSSLPLPSYLDTSPALSLALEDCVPTKGELDRLGELEIAGDSGCCSTFGSPPALEVFGVELFVIFLEFFPGGWRPVNVKGAGLSCDSFSVAPLSIPS